MGQARRRGSVEQRISEAKFYLNERERLDNWFKEREVVERFSVNKENKISQSEILLVLAIETMGLNLMYKEFNK